MAEPHDESESSLGPDKTEPEANASRASRRGGRGSGARSGRRGSRRRRALLPKRKRRSARWTAEAGPSRDRNRRLREEMAGGGRAKPGARAIPARNLEAGEIVDDALARSTQAAGEWLKRNANVVQWVVIVCLVGWVGYAIYSYRAGRAAEQASAKLSTAIRAEGARIGTDETKADPQTGLVETRPSFASEELRLKAAEQAVPRDRRRRLDLRRHVRQARPGLGALRSGQVRRRQGSLPGGQRQQARQPRSGREGSRAGRRRHQLGSHGRQRRRAQGVRRTVERRRARLQRARRVPPGALGVRRGATPTRPKNI